MSGRAEFLRLKERVAGKWQIPLLLLSLALLAGSVLRIDSPQSTVPFETICERIAAQIEGRMYTLAVTDGRRLLGALEDRSDIDAGRARPQVYRLLGRALALRAERGAGAGGVDEGVAAEVLDAFQRAQKGGQPLTWQDHRLIALAHEWQDQYSAAISEYEEAAARAPARDGLTLRKRILELMESPLAAPPAVLLEGLDSFMADALATEGALELLEWAARCEVELLCAEGRRDDALTLLDDLRPVFEPTRLRESFEYLSAWVLYKVRRFDEAEAALRALRNRLAVRDEVHAKSGWLLGRVVLSDGGPQRPAEALSFFRDVISSHASGLYVDASRLGMGEALAALERFDESLAQYRKVVPTINEHRDSPVINADVVRTSATVAAYDLRRRADLERALAFMQLASALVDPVDIPLTTTYLKDVGSWQAALARELKARARQLPDDPENQEARTALNVRSRSLLETAAETYLELAHINTLNEKESAKATWKAADLFDEAGNRGRTVLVFREFARERPGDPLVPRALLRLGQSLQAMGRYQEAIEAYQENHTRFPRTPDAGSALVPMARCFMALGPEYYDQAEKTLRIILDDSPIFTPEAPEFADALFMLADLSSRQGMFEEAIPLLDEAMHRYADDPRIVKAEFQLADAYRQSGRALRADLTKAELVGERRRLEAEHVERLQEAMALFGQLVHRFEDRAETELDPLERLFLRYGRLYEADCLFDLRRYGPALKKYERAAWIYRDSTSALAAYVQIINCHVYLGQPTEAQAALRRARHLLDTLPDTRFADAALTGARTDWEQYFNWVEQADLF